MFRYSCFCYSLINIYMQKQHYRWDKKKLNRFLRVLAIFHSESFNFSFLFSLFSYLDKSFLTRCIAWWESVSLSKWTFFSRLLQECVNYHLDSFLPSSPWVMFLHQTELFGLSSLFWLLHSYAVSRANLSVRLPPRELVLSQPPSPVPGGSSCPNVRFLCWNLHNISNLLFILVSTSLWNIILCTVNVFHRSRQ